MQRIVIDPFEQHLLNSLVNTSNKRGLLFLVNRVFSTNFIDSQEALDFYTNDKKVI